MAHLTWRRFLAGAGVAAATTLTLSGYATAYETGAALTLADYAPAFAIGRKTANSRSR